MGVGVAVKAGGPKPDIHDVDAFKKSMLAAKSVMYANPAKGGQSGIHVAKVLRSSASTRRSARKSSCAIAGRTA